MKKFYVAVFLLIAFMAGAFVIGQVFEKKIAAREKKGGWVRCLRVRHDVSEKEFESLVTNWSQVADSEIDYTQRLDGNFTVTQITPAINGMCLE